MTDMLHKQVLRSAQNDKACYPVSALKKFEAHALQATTVDSGLARDCKASSIALSPS
jgi:hypothetical protein